MDLFFGLGCRENVKNGSLVDNHRAIVQHLHWQRVYLEEVPAPRVRTP